MRIRGRGGGQQSIAILSRVSPPSSRVIGPPALDRAVGKNAQATAANVYFFFYKKKKKIEIKNKKKKINKNNKY